MKRIVLAASLAACHGSDRVPATDDGNADIDAPVSLGDAGLAMLESHQLCKLLSNRNTSDPTANDVQHRANVLGADLGIPVAHDDVLYILFGDTIGRAGIWSPPESHPDSVGIGLDSATAIAAQPDLLCSRLGILALPPGQSVGPHVDPSIVADFAGASMAPPSGHTIGEFIRNPSGGNGGATFANLPGDFEVPSGAFSAGDSIYVFYTTVVGPGDVTMKASYLARWVAPTRTSPPNYQIQYAIDERFDGNGPLQGQFINVAAEVAGDYVYVFGTGTYRASGITVARKRLDSLATPGGFEPVGTVTATPGYGEVSARYFASLGRWVVLAEELLPGSNRIVAYLAADPAGPWSGPVTIHDMGDPAFRAQYCCGVEDDCQGEQMFNCNRTGFYGTYMLPTALGTPGAFTIAYTMSSFSPYNVALFQTTFTNF